MATLAERNRAKRIAATKAKAAKRAANVEAGKAEHKRILDAANARQSKKLADKRAADRKKAADKKKSEKKKETKKKETKKKETKKKETKKEDRDNRGSDDKKKSSKKKSTGKTFFGTNIPLSAVKDANKRDEINNRLKADIAAGDWDGANDALFSAAFNTVEGGQGQGNPNVSKVHSGEWKVTKSPKSWAETSINSSNDVYKQKDGSVVSWDDSKGVLKDGVSTGSWGGQGTGENNQRSGQAPPPSGVKGAAPINPVFSGTNRKGGMRDISTIFGAGTTGGAGTAGGGGGGLLGEYQIPDRTFDWETDPSEQALFASAIGRPDLAKTMLTGQYGPLAGQQYKYGAGRTRINYGPGGGYGGGAGAGAGAGGSGSVLGPLGGSGTAGAGGGKTYGPGGKHDNYHDWYMDPANQFGHQWAIDNAARAKGTSDVTIPAGTGTGRSAGVGGRLIASPASGYQQDALGMEDYVPPTLPNTPPPGFGTSPQLYMDDLSRMQREAAESRRIATGAGLDFSGMPSHSDLSMRASRLNPYDTFNPAQAAMGAAAANPYDFGAGRPEYLTTGGAAPFLPFKPQTPVQMEMGTGIAPAPWLVGPR